MILKKYLPGWFVFIVCLPIFWMPGTGLARDLDDAHPSIDRAWQGISDHLECGLRMLSFAMIQDPADSTQNPGNAFLNLPRRRVGLEVRPDLSLDMERFHLMAKPRLNLGWRKWEAGDRDGDTLWEDDWFVNEWLFRAELHEALFLSYGRENLQWGPSYLLSPSNPFFRDNGRGNPKQEVPGMDFARLVWLADPAWTVSFILNLDEGRQPLPSEDFRKTSALKIDYTGQTSYAGLILSHREKDRDRLGLFAGWTATDALLVYGEGTLAGGGDAYYPRKDGGPLGASMEPLYEDDDALQATILCGGSYTLEMGPTLTLEYVYNGPGYADGDAEEFYRLRDRAARGLQSPEPVRGLGALVLSRTLDPGLRLLRRHYVMFQYNHTDIRDVLSLTLRWTRNLDDRSGRFLSILEYSIGDHTSLFSVATLNTGGGDRSFGTLVELQWMAGVEYAF